MAHLGQNDDYSVIQDDNYFIEELQNDDYSIEQKYNFGFHTSPQYNTSCAAKRSKNNDAGEKSNDELRQIIVQQQRKELFEEGLLSDFTIVCGGKEGENGEKKFSVHRNILAAGSQYFKAMLTNEAFDETKTGVLKIQDFGEETIRPLLAFIYCGEKPLFLPLDQMKDLFRAADMYQLDELKKICEQRLINTLEVGNALELLAFADIYHARAPKLKTEAINFVNANKAAVSNGDNWIDFVCAHPLLIAELYLTV